MDCGCEVVYSTDEQLSYNALQKEISWLYLVNESNRPLPLCQLVRNPSWSWQSSWPGHGIHPNYTPCSPAPSYLSSPLLPWISRPASCNSPKAWQQRFSIHYYVIFLKTLGRDFDDIKQALHASLVPELLQRYGVHGTTAVFSPTSSTLVDINDW